MELIIVIALLAIGCTIGALLSGSYGPEDFETHNRRRVGIDPRYPRSRGPRL